MIISLYDKGEEDKTLEYLDTYIICAQIIHHLRVSKGTKHGGELVA